MPKRDTPTKRPVPTYVVTRRGLLAGTSALAAGAIAAHPALAQASEANWWERLPGFGTPGGQSRVSEPRERKIEPLEDLRPDSVPFRSDVMLDNLEQAIARYQQIANKGGWPSVATGRQLRPGDDDERVVPVRRRLWITGDLPQSNISATSYNFDSALEIGLKRFQQRHGLRVSGRLDYPTQAALNVSPQARIAQLRLNLTRLRELLQGRIEERYILVNIPGFQLEAVERFEVEQRHRVIVGRTERQTPSIKATIRALNFFPYWRVPDSVAHLDLIPRLQKEPEYLEKEKIRVFAGFNGPELNPGEVDWTSSATRAYKFRQDPGPQNALGLVRIDMPNEHIVYMHDTPLKKLFEQRGRAYSAGCVRVQDVMKLAAWIARPDGWDDARVEATLNGGQAVDLPLARPVPVYFAYLTAWAERDGTVEFRPDIYGRDGARELAAAHDPDAPPPPSEGLAP